MSTPTFTHITPCMSLVFGPGGEIAAWVGVNLLDTERLCTEIDAAIASRSVWTVVQTLREIKRMFEQTAAGEL